MIYPPASGVLFKGEAITVSPGLLTVKLLTIAAARKSASRATTGSWTTVVTPYMIRA
jgi:hypothetical protein